MRMRSKSSSVRAPHPAFMFKLNLAPRHSTVLYHKSSNNFNFSQQLQLKLRELLWSYYTQMFPIFCGFVVYKSSISRNIYTHKKKIQISFISNYFGLLLIILSE